MKKELLEYIIRETVQQLLEVGAIEDPTVGAPAPPEAGQASVDQSPIPKPDAPAVPFMNSPAKGVWFVDPKKTKPIQLQFRGSDPRSIETAVYQTAAKSGGPNIKPSLDTLRKVNASVKNPASVLFLFVGKSDPADPDSDVAIMSAPTLQQATEMAQQAAGQSAERSGTAISSDPQDLQGMAQNWQTQQAGGKTLAPDIDEAAKFRNMVSSMIKETLSDLNK